MGILRLLLALSVLADHCGSIFTLELVQSKIAVQSFYIISGFYMSLIINEKYINKNNSFFLFITNRFFRLFPIYWVVLFLTVVLCLTMGILTKFEQFPKFDSYFAVAPNVSTFIFLIMANLFIFGQDLIMFLGINSNTGVLYFTSNFNDSSLPLHSFLFIPQAWTLGLELSFYLIAPFILRKKLALVTGLIAMSIGIRIYIYYFLGLRHDPWSYRFFPSELVFFLLGYCSYLVYKKNRIAFFSPKIRSLVLFCVIAFTTLYSFVPDLNPGNSPFTLKESMFFSLIIFTIPILFDFSQRHKWDIAVGELSYPVYISHILVGSICTVIPYSVFKSGAFIALISILFSYFLNKVVMPPIEKYRQSRLTS